MKHDTFRRAPGRAAPRRCVTTLAALVLVALVGALVVLVRTTGNGATACGRTQTWPGAVPPGAARRYAADCACERLVEWSATFADSVYPATPCRSGCLPSRAGRVGYAESPCWAGNMAGGDPTACLRRPPGDERPLVFLVGDSHALHWLPGVAGAFLPRGRPVAFAGWAGGCGLFSRGFIDAWFRNNGDNYFVCPAGECVPETCYAFADAALAALEGSLRAGDVLAVAHWNRRHLTANQSDVTFLEDVVVDLVARKGAALLLLSDTPTAEPIDDPVWANLTRARGDALRARGEADFPGLAARHANVYYFNATLDLLCWDGACPGVIPGTDAVPGFWDANHLTTAGSLYLGGHLSCFLEEHGL